MFEFPEDHEIHMQAKKHSSSQNSNDTIPLNTQQKELLLASAKWAKHISRSGFIIIFFALLFIAFTWVLVANVDFNTETTDSEPLVQLMRTYFSFMGTMFLYIFLMPLSILQLFIIILTFYPLFTLGRVARHIQEAINHYHSDDFIPAFKKLKSILIYSTLLASLLLIVSLGISMLIIFPS